MSAHRIEPEKVIAAVTTGVLAAVLALLLFGAHVARGAGLPVLRRSAASQVTLAWDHSMTNLDGTPITATNRYTRILRSTDFGENWSQLSNPIFPIDRTTSTVTTGVYWFVGTTVTIVNDRTNDSEWSEILVWTNLPIVPAPFTWR